MPRSITSFVPAALLAVAACDAQVGRNYHGQPLATLTGGLVSNRSEPLPDPQVSLVWTHYGEMYDLIGAEKIDAQGLFPQFQLAIYNPPADDVSDVIDGEKYTVGLLAVGTTQTDFTVATQWYGVDFDRVAMYLPDGTKPGGTLEAFLHGAQTPGFHVYSVKRLTEAERQAALDCVNALPDVGGGPDLPWREVYLQCGGAGNDELYPVDTDLTTQFDVEILADQDILTIVNHLPHW